MSAERHNVDVSSGDSTGVAPVSFKSTRSEAVAEKRSDLGLNKKTLYRGIKRGVDIISAIGLLGITAPLFVVIGLLIKAEDSGRCFFVHDRVGLHGKRIRIYKFRSMHTGAEDLERILCDKDIEEYYREYKLKTDPRVTETGRRLRRTYMDELPQLFNVLRGEMSMVGPRPITDGELSFYREDELTRLLSVKPGLTGYWQVYGKNHANYQNGLRQEMEIYYADHANLKLDAKVLIKTPVMIFAK